MEVNQRIRFKDKPFLSGGYIKAIHHQFGDENLKPAAYTVKLDEKAPNEYAWNTDEVLAFPAEIEPVDKK